MFHMSLAEGIIMMTEAEVEAFVDGIVRVLEKNPMLIDSQIARVDRLLGACKVRCGVCKGSAPCEHGSFVGV